MFLQRSTGHCIVVSSRDKPRSAEAICYGIEFAYKVRMLGWRGYFMGPDARSWDVLVPCVGLLE